MEETLIQIPQKTTVTYVDVKRIHKSKAPIITVRIDKSLDKYDNMILFPEKVEKAKEAFARLGVPDLSKMVHKR